MAKSTTGITVEAPVKKVTKPTPQVAAIKGTAPLGIKEKKAVISPAELAGSIPGPKPKAKVEKKMGDKDVYGFGKESETSFLVNRIESGKYTRVELLAAFIKHFCETKKDADQGGDKRKRVSFSVFFSDVKKPFGTYHASRSLIIIDDPKTKKLTLDAKRADAVREAIGKGLLAELRGKNKNNHPQKINAILKSHGLPLLEVAAK